MVVQDLFWANQLLTIFRPFSQESSGEENRKDMLWGSPDFPSQEFGRQQKDSNNSIGGLLTKSEIELIKATVQEFALVLVQQC